MEFVELFNLPLNANIIDIGGGDSHFVDALLDKSYKNIYVLDISAKAIERVKERLGNKASKVRWIVSDITDFEPMVQFDFWHDRAECIEEEHRTPFNTIQNFLFCSFRKK